MKKLRENYENAVNAYVDELLRRWELSRHYTWLVGDRVGINTFCFGDIHSMSLDDIIYCVENDVTYKEYLENEDYNIQALEFHFGVINIKSWHEGSPRVPKETFSRLQKMKDDLEKAIDEEAAKYNINK